LTQNFKPLCIRSTDLFDIKHILVTKAITACICLVLRKKKGFFNLQVFTEWSLYNSDVLCLVCSRTDC